MSLFVPIENHTYQNFKHFIKKIPQRAFVPIATLIEIVQALPTFCEGWCNQTPIWLSQRQILVGRTLIFGQPNKKMMRVAATKSLVITTKTLVGATKFLVGATKFLVGATKFFLVSVTKFLVSATSHFLTLLSFHRSA